MAKKKRYALVGTGGRGQIFYEAIAHDFRDTAELVGFCDTNPTRMAFANRRIGEVGGHRPVPLFTPDRFDEMITTTRPDAVIVTSIDRTHHRYIVRAMQLGCDVISEKPMTIDEDKCQAIFDAVRATGRSLRVTFNYRYAPHSTKVRELVRDGAIGEVTNVHFEWMLDTSHGADYFRRWHRDKRNSGGLLVHKSTHHFDLVNFWIASRPKTVFAFGDLRFYGRENAESRGVTRFYARAHGSETARDDPFALHLEESPLLTSLYLDAEKDDGYQRDQSVFGDGISIEDTMSVLVKYHNRTQMSYSLVAYAPWEGFRAHLTGTQGRLEIQVVESSYVNAGGDRQNEGALRDRRITVYPMFGAPYEPPIPTGEGGHGGGDRVLLNDLFGTPEPDPFNRAASHLDGAWSILTGIAANKAMRTGRPVDVDTLVSL
jgi:predicted dehydrogenase